MQDALQKLIKKNTISTKPKSDLYYNKHGNATNEGGSDDIYIECKPTGGDGEVIVSKDTPLFGDTITKEMLNKTFGNKFMGVLIGVALMVGLINVATIVVDKISGGASPTSKK